MNMSNRITTRRDFLKSTGKAGIAAGLSFSAFSSFAQSKSPYEQTPLPYAYNALEPTIDGQTMELHYSKHAAAYAKALGEAVAAENVNKQSTSLESLLAKISKYSSKMRNNAGGHYNHELFWKCMQPGNEAGKPSGKLLTAIEKDFNSFEAFKNQFGEVAKNRFGSGWAWLISGKDKKLRITSTPNQDNPLMDVSDTKGIPLLGLDVWEHAYYLKYQNKRPEYISAWWNVVNWKFIEQQFAAV
jgi:superoxide dismutase, Fe-Mn family